MAIAVASVTTNAMGVGGVFAKPTGLAVGDTMLAIMVAEGTQNLASPAGWTTVGDSDTATYTKTRAFSKVADSSDVAASNFTFTGTDIRGGILYRITGGGLLHVDVADPIANQSLVIIWAHGGDNAGRTTTFSGYSVTGGASPTFTERLDSNESTGLTTCFAVADGIYNSNANISAFSVTADSSVDEVSSKILVFEAQQDANADISHLAIPPTLTGLESSNTATADVSHLAVTPSINGVEATNSSDRTQWTNEAKPTTTWTNQTK